MKEVFKKHNFDRYMLFMLDLNRFIFLINRIQNWTDPCFNLLKICSLKNYVISDSGEILKIDDVFYQSSVDNLYCDIYIVGKKYNSKINTVEII